jgi:hypothetical protein
MGAVILAVVVTRIPVEAFKAAVTEGPHAQLAIVTLTVMCGVLAADALATWIGMHALDVARPLSRVFAVRGATYLLALVNYAVGQGAFGYYLHRTGVAPSRSIGITLFLIGTNLATLLLVTTLAWAIGGPTDAFPVLWWTLLGGTGAFVVYLVIIAIAPRFLAERAVLAPLFDAGLRGHAIAIVGRLPHSLVIILGHWLALRTWGIPAPIWAGMTLMPAVAIASVLPISPAGLGTTQAAFVVFFSTFAAGATGSERSAHVLAFAVVYFVYGVASAIIVGLSCTPFARRFGVLPPGA